jgi:hypothetical protein
VVKTFRIEVDFLLQSRRQNRAIFLVNFSIFVYEVVDDYFGHLIILPQNSTKTVAFISQTRYNAVMKTCEFGKAVTLALLTAVVGGGRF